MTKSRGVRAKTRTKLQVRKRHKFKISNFLKKFNDGNRVAIDIDASVQNGMPHPRFQGLSGTIEEKRGRSYGVKIRDGRKEKIVYVHPVHLKRL